MQKQSQTGLSAKECIVTALISLMKQTDYNKITITDITRKAGVSRMAYYRNYHSKEDILNQYMDGVGQEIHRSLAAVDNAEKLHDYFYALFKELGQHSDIGIASVRAHLGELILQNINKNMQITFGHPHMTAAEKYARYLMAGAFYNVYLEWIKGGCREAPEEMADICSRMLHAEYLL